MIHLAIFRRLGVRRAACGARPQRDHTLSDSAGPVTCPDCKARLVEARDSGNGDSHRARVDDRRRMRNAAFAQAARRARAEDKRMVVWIRPEPDEDVWYVRSWEEGKPAGAKLAGEVDQDGDIRDVHLGFTGTY